jgi:hypothetical protein
MPFHYAYGNPHKLTVDSHIDSTLLRLSSYRKDNDELPLPDFYILLPDKRKRSSLALKP